MTLDEAVRQLLDKWHSPYDTDKWSTDLMTALREVEKAFYAKLASEKTNQIVN